MLFQSGTHPVDEEGSPQSSTELKFCIVPEQDPETYLSGLSFFLQGRLDLLFDVLHRLVLDRQSMQTRQNIVSFFLITACVIPIRMVSRQPCCGKLRCSTIGEYPVA